MSPSFDLLGGMKILDLSRLLPGPFATMVLADYGAEVLKLEAPGEGDYLRSWAPLVAGTSAFFHAVNRNKKSLTLNLKAEAGRRLFFQLVGECDVVFESFRPGVMERLGCGFKELSAVKPELIYASISGYGQSGPESLKAGHDLNYMAETGVLNTTASRDISKLSGVQVADVAGGALTAVGAVLAAYVRVLKGGRGCFLDISMTDGLVSMLPLLSAYHYALGMEPGPDSTMFNGQLACYQIYRTADDREIALGALEEKFWRNFCAAVGRDDLAAGDHQEAGRQDYLKQELGRLFASRDAAAWTQLLAGRDTCCEVLRTMAEVQAQAHYQKRGMFWQLPLTDGGSLTQTNCPVMIDGAKPRSHRPAPALGEHTDEVLTRLGLAPADISDLRRQGVV